ncbi:hypothetical protein NOMA109596_06860 [Nocardioides marinus]|uniref:Uncharacterized protein n=1 Tax=Nocardioides marinus TaxID=374514 RepID=A0A7Z0C488_9ACTN|nr:hypothetical protein [Nocardioides marinus]NYI09864.1 hypothetical protein [Nocardioides marinus]
MVEDWIWDGPDDLPGYAVTLALLYHFVPTAEEVDLLDELDHDRSRAAWNAFYDEFASAEDGIFSADLDEYDQADDQDEATSAPMSLGQIFGLLEHVLGAEIIDDPADGDAGDK